MSYLARGPTYRVGIDSQASAASGRHATADSTIVLSEAAT
jgi:hypothetical protein